MSLYLDTRGLSQCGIGVCARCNRKFPLVELMADGNAGPGMRVCKADRDNYDPWRLPARRTEDITLQYPRPDVSLTGYAEGAAGDLLTETEEPLFTQDDLVLMTEV